MNLISYYIWFGRWNSTIYDYCEWDTLINFSYLKCFMRIGIFYHKNCYDNVFNVKLLSMLQNYPIILSSQWFQSKFTFLFNHSLHISMWWFHYVIKHLTLNIKRNSHWMSLIIQIIKYRKIKNILCGVFWNSIAFVSLFTLSMEYQTPYSLDRLFRWILIRSENKKWNYSYTYFCP